MQDSYLFPTLEAGTSRVFNVCLRTEELRRSEKSDVSSSETEGDAANTNKQEEKDSSEATLLFFTKDLNNVIVVKEARPNRDKSKNGPSNTVGTKLYLPYNVENIYEGGKSVFVDDSQIGRVLADHAGLQDEEQDEHAARDLRIINCMNEIPSLDPFLLRDKIEIEKIPVNESYFLIPDGEWKKIRDDVSDKLKPIIEFAYPKNEDKGNMMTTTLIDKLWNTKDIASLKPIIDAFGLPEEEASEIFASWKGITYYDYEYGKSLGDWKQAIEWLAYKARPTDFIDNSSQAMLFSLKERVNQQYKESWSVLKTKLAEYHYAYDQLFVARTTPKPFIDYMRNAVDTYWDLGSRISAINHSVAVWNILTANAFEGQLKYDQLYTLLDIQRGIFDSVCDSR